MSTAPPVVHDFRVDKSRVRKRALRKARANRPPGTRAQPPVIVFEAEAGSPESALPPVRIFLGTEPLQFKAERVFLYSISKFRNPGRRYEVYLMKDLDGYDRDGWATGFTRYRFAIPYMAGGTGRAIYNDVDQIYLADPAELFDRDMDGMAILAIDRKETSVMLMDCGKLAEIWNIDLGKDSDARFGTPEAVHEAGLWGIMPGVWNSRDTEYVAGESKLLHFTTLDKQPWQPFPAAYDYRTNENDHVWRELETEANAARFLSHTRDDPSPRFTELAASSAKAESGHDHREAVARLIRSTGANTLLHYTAGTDAPDAGDWPGVTVTRCNPFTAEADGSFDAVILTDILEHVPEEDIPWVLDDAFRRARSVVYASIPCYPPAQPPPMGRDMNHPVRLPEWWRGQMELASTMHPHVGWELHVPTRAGSSALTGMVRSLFGAPPERFSHTA